MSVVPVARARPQAPGAVPERSESSALGQPLVRTTDLDQAVEQVNALMSPHTVTPTGPGRHTVRVDGCTVPGLAVLHMDYGRPIRVVAEPLDDYYALCVPLASSMAVHHNGRRFDAAAGGSAFLGTPESELVMDWREGLRLLVVRVDVEEVRRLAGYLAGPNIDAGPDPRFEPEVRSPAVTTSTLGQARLMHEILARTGGTPVNPAVAAQLREQVVFSLLLGHQNSWLERLGARHGSGGDRAVREAAEMLRGRAGDDVTVGEVAAAVGLSIRALELGFRRVFDRTPRQFLREQRMDRAHQDLALGSRGEGVSVHDIAMRWGFAHPGRFARAYEQRYGEYPKQTLRTDAQ